MAEEPTGLGISWLWKLPDSHPFYFAAVNHDKAYDLKWGKSSYRVDQVFLKECLSVSDTYWLKMQAYTFYGLARSWGAVKWKQRKSKSLFFQKE